MNTVTKKIKLTENDKKIIINHSNICTETHGKGCSTVYLSGLNRKLN